MKNYREVKIGPYSAYAIAKKNGFEGTEEEWLESLKPPAVDPTLSEEGKAADAKVTGDELARKAVIDDTTVGTDAWSAKHLVDMLCPPISETGNPMVCYPVAGYPLGCKVSWEPTQQGEGTPYPAGGGPNLLDISQCTATVGKPYGVTITIDGDVFKISGVPSSEVTEENQYSFAVASCTQTELRGKGYKITPFALKGNVSSAWGLRTEDEDSLAIAAKLTPGVNTDIQLRLMVSKDTPAAYAPYENIRSIKGRNSVTVERCGENLLDVAQCRAATPSAAYGLTVTVDDTGLIRVFGIPKVNKDNPRATFRILFTNQVILTKEYKAKWFVVKGVINAITPIQKDKSIVLQSPLLPNTSVDVQFRLMYYTGDEPTTYAPYTGQTSTLTLPSTIYGGTVDAVSGVGKEVWKSITLDGVSEKFVNEYDDYWNLIPMNTPGISNQNIDYIVSSHFYHAFGGNITGFLFTTSSMMKRYFATPDELNAYIAAQYAAGTPVQIAYKLVTPEPFTATGAQPIPALPGVNTLMTDADSVTVTGRADPIKRITDLEDAVASMTNT